MLIYLPLQGNQVYLRISQATSWQAGQIHLVRQIFIASISLKTN